jgi:spore maturation protein CgeB
MRIAFFGSSLLSAYWNGAATYYRGLICALHALGHRITFYEPDAHGRQQHLDMEEPPWAKVVVYGSGGTSSCLFESIEQARDADLVIKASGVGVFEDVLERAVLEARKPGGLVAFWDVDAPATLDRLKQNPEDAFAALIPQYDFIFTYGGGDPVVRAYKELGARQCIPIYNALDPSTHFPTSADLRFRGELAFLGNRLPDREARVDEFFFRPAASSPDIRFVLGGAGWETKLLPEGVRFVGHVYTRDHNAFNSTPRAVLNISRESMARNGYSPATRVFEAAGAAACLITDHWEGIEMFLEPGREALVARDGAEVAELVRWLLPEKARAIGAAARKRVLAEHTYDHRARQVDAVLR